MTTQEKQLFDPATVTWDRVSERLIVMRRLIALGVNLVVAIAVMFAPVAAANWTWRGLALVLVGAMSVWEFWLIGRQVRAIGYCERADDLIIRRGILFRQLVVVPYGRMQFVDVQSGPIERIFNLASVELHTASPTTKAQIRGLLPEEASRLRDRLATRGEAQMAGL